METLTAEGVWLDSDGRTSMADVDPAAVAEVEDALLAVTEIYASMQGNCTGVYHPCGAGIPPCCYPYGCNGSRCVPAG
jgi:hypothetical protein